MSARAALPIRLGSAPRRGPGVPPGLDAELVAELVVLRAGLRECKVSIPDAALARELADVARYAAAQLPRESAMALWHNLVSPTCEKTLSSPMRDWLALH